MAHTMGVPFDLDTVMRLAEAARPVGDRRQLRRAGLRGIAASLTGTFGDICHRFVLSRPSHHHGRGRLRCLPADDLLGADRPLDP